MQSFDSVVVELAEHLENPGDSLSLRGTLSLETFQAGDKEYHVEEPFTYDIVLTHAGDGILVTGIVRGRAHGVCDRCLENAAFDVAGELDEYYLFEEPLDPQAFEDGFELVGTDRKLDLSDAIWDALVMDIPFVLLCREDCAGLCPQCGANRNETPCSCGSNADDEDSAANPFAVLKDLKLD